MKHALKNTHNSIVDTYFSICIFVQLLSTPGPGSITGCETEGNWKHHSSASVTAPF